MDATIRFAKVPCGDLPRSGMDVRAIADDTRYPGHQVFGAEGVVALQAPALYYPYIHIRDDNWLKSAALYWPSVRRLRPRGYALHDSAVSEAFADAGVLRNEDPGPLVHAAGLEMVTAMAANANALADKYSVDAADGAEQVERPLFGVAGAERLGWIHITKFDPDALQLLSEHGLVVRGRRPPDEGVPWSSAHGGAPDRWVGMHPALAGAYMATLAETASRHSHLQPLTDQDDLRRTTPSGDVREALQLLGQPPAHISHRSDGLSTYVALAIMAAVPTDLGSVDVDRILKCRENLEEELGNFREFVSAQVGELAGLAATGVDHRRLEAFNEHVQATIEVPLRSLERSMALLKLDTTRSVLTTSSLAAPPITTFATNAIGAPLVAQGVSTVAAIGAAWWTVAANRSSVKANSPVAYLFDVRRRLTPTSFAGRVKALLFGR